MNEAKNIFDTPEGRNYLRRMETICDAENAFRQLGKPSEFSEYAVLYEAKEQGDYSPYTATRSFVLAITNWVMPFKGMSPVSDEDLRYNCDATLVSKALEVLEHYGLAVKITKKEVEL